LEKEEFFPNFVRRAGPVSPKDANPLTRIPGKFWVDLADRFKAVADKPTGLALQADWREDGFGDGWPNWVLLGGTASERESFRALARMGAVALGNAGGEDGYLFWLNRIKRDRVDFRDTAVTLRKKANDTTTDPGNTTTAPDDTTDLDEGRPDGPAGSIADVWAASARYCLLCEARVLEAQEAGNDDAGSADETDNAPALPLAVCVDPGSAAATPNERRALVETFCESCYRETSVRVLKKHIYLAARHKTPRQFNYWMAGTDRPTGSKSRRGASVRDNQNFLRILSMKPADFVELLQKLRAL
jgi:hypothetical protein